MGDLFELLILGMTLALLVLVQIARARDNERVVAINSAPLGGRVQNPNDRGGRALSARLPI